MAFTADSPGHHQDVLGHLGVPAGLLVVFKLSFIEHPLPAVAAPGGGSALYDLPNLLFVTCMISIPYSFSPHVDGVSTLQHELHKGCVLPSVNKI